MLSKTGVIIGATGAQGSAVVKHFSLLYKLKIITRNIRSESARELAVLPNVSVVLSRSSGYDEDTFLLAARDADFVFINTDGFSVGEVTETFLGIRYYELACEANVKHFIYSSLDDLGKLTNFDADFHSGSYYAKARVVDFLRSQPERRTKWSAISATPYMEMLHEWLAPTIMADAAARFSWPLDRRSIPMLCLKDFARYVAYIVENPESTQGKVLEVATCHVTGDQIAQAFSSATGKRASYVDMPLQEYLEVQFKNYRRGVDSPVGLQTFTHVGGTSAERVFTTNMATKPHIMVAYLEM